MCFYESLLVQDSFQQGKGCSLAAIASGVFQMSSSGLSSPSLDEINASDYLMLFVVNSY